MINIDFGVNIWSIVSGVLTIYTLVPCVRALVQSQHPETRLAELDATLKDTEALFRSVVEEGLLHPVRHVPHFEFNLTSCGSRL